jgi:NADPH:quinone reductase-like Zn-dependent oxidoreductase
MKAAVHTRYGPPEVVQISEVKKPAAEDNELLIKVHATTVNRTNCGFRSGKPFFSRFFTGLVRPRGTVMGHEFAGRVEAVGSDVTFFEIADRVFGFIGFSGPFGAHAEYVTIPEDGPLATILANLTYEEAAPVPKDRIMPSRTAGRQISGAPTKSSTTRPKTSQKTISNTKRSSMRSARARSAGAGGC